MSGTTREVTGRSPYGTLSIIRASSARVTPLWRPSCTSSATLPSNALRSGAPTTLILGMRDLADSFRLAMVPGHRLQSITSARQATPELRREERVVISPAPAASTAASTEESSQGYADRSPQG